MNLLGNRQFCTDSSFVHMSTNKVYGDGPNNIQLKELDTHGITMIQTTKMVLPNLFPLISASTHSWSIKVAADIMVQEYGDILACNMLPSRRL